MAMVEEFFRLLWYQQQNSKSNCMIALQGSFIGFE